MTLYWYMRIRELMSWVSRVSNFFVRTQSFTYTLTRLGYCVAQLRAIFTLSPHLKTYQKPVAYIKYFLPFTRQHHGSNLSAVKQSYKANNNCEAAVISLDSIRCSCHLIPNFGSKARANAEWTSDNILEECNSFFLNPYISREFFQMSLG